MPCNHKFKRDLTLDRIEYEPETLIVGTFNPEWPAGNTAEWFYGRINDGKGGRWNNFWDVLPRVYGEESLIDASPATWKLFCKQHKIALTDLIGAIDDADEGNKDHSKILLTYVDDALVHHFDDFEFINIVQLLKRRPSIKNVYFTRGITESFWRHLWNPVMQYCNRNNIYIASLLTPVGATMYQHDAYNTANPDATIARVEDYILKRWQEEFAPQFANAGN